jgi:hypothetical protein
VATDDGVVMPVPCPAAFAPALGLTGGGSPTVVPLCRFRGVTVPLPPCAVPWPNGLSGEYRGEPCLLMLVSREATLLAPPEFRPEFAAVRLFREEDAEEDALANSVRRTAAREGMWWWRCEDALFARAGAFVVGAVDVDVVAETADAVGG